MFNLCKRARTFLSRQRGEHDGVSVGQPAAPLPADAAAGRPHPGLRAGPHAVLCDGRHPHLRLVQPGLRSGPGGRRRCRQERAQSRRVLRVHGEVSGIPTVCHMDRKPSVLFGLFRLSVFKVIVEKNICVA